MNKLLNNDGELVNKIANAMAQGHDHRFMQYSKDLPSGYTYVGQFIAHELAPMTDTFRASRVVSGKMDLQSVYGTAHNYQLQHLEDNNLLFDPKGRFKFSSKTKLDFQRNKNGDALIPEQRNDDNVIVAQQHLFWQRLHNHLINKALAKDARAAKKLVVLTFQMMVVEDYLRRIMDEGVYQQMIVNNHNYLSQIDAPWFEVFRYATFRFGHSMIRNHYNLRLACDDENAERSLSELFIGNRCPRHMTDDDYIDWRQFFCLEADNARFEGVMPIDTRISTIMTEIPDEVGRNIAIDIAVRNITSELSAGLPGGIALAKKVRRALPGDIKHDFRLLNDRAIESATFNQLDLTIDDLTVWLYSLLEAQLLERPHKLGIVASSVNTHVIKQSIEQAGLSIYRHGQYDFDRVVNQLEGWGQVLKSFSINNKTKGCGAITMADLVNYLCDNE